MHKELRLGASAAAALLVFCTPAAAQQDGLDSICGDCVFEKFATCGGFLEGATVDSRGTLWVVDLLSGNVLSVAGGRCEVRANTGGQPNGAKFHRDGRLFIADKALGILAYDPSANTITTIMDTYRAERLRGTNDLVFDNEGGLYFTEPYGSGATNPNGRVFYLPPGRLDRPVVAAEGLAFPNGVAVTPGGAILVGEFAKKQVLSVPAVGSPNVFDIPHVFARTVGGIGPDGMAFDEAGNLYAANFQGKAVDVIGPDARPIGSLRLPQEAGMSVTNLAFHDGWLYVTEASIGEVWRVRLSNAGLPLFHQTQ